VPEVPDQPQVKIGDDEPMYVVVQFSAHARFRRTVYMTSSLIDRSTTRR
jgi:hypothetical protein